MSVWTRPAASHAVAPLAQASRPRLGAGVGGEEGDQAEQVVGGADQALEAGLGDAQLAAHLRGLVARQLRQLRLDPGADRDRRRVRARRRAPRAHPAPRSRPRRRWRRRGRASRSARGGCAPRPGAASGTGDRAHGLVAAQRLDDLPRASRAPRRPPCRPSSPAWRRGRWRATAVSRSAWRSSASTISASRAGSVPPSGCGTPSSPWARTTWQIASVSRIAARKRLPRPSPSDAPRTSPAMSWNSTVSGTAGLAPAASATGSRRSSGTGDHRDVLVHGREGVDRGLGARQRERVEQRRLPGVGKPDDPDLHDSGAVGRSPSSPGSERPIIVPSAAPARTSEG